MNQKSFVIAAILAATALSVIATPLVYADTSATVTGQNVQQKNSGIIHSNTNAKYVQIKPSS
jgi:hypothetical protein